MKTFFLTTLFLTIFSHINSQKNFLSDEFLPQLSDSEILPGMGYSSDRKNLAATLCYKTISVTNGQQSSQMNFQSAVDIQKLSEVFEINLSMSSSAWQFSGNAQASYLRSLQEDSYSLSYFYYFKLSSVSSILFSYDPTTILNDVGKNIYNDGKNPLFRIFCGDKLITTYNVGASLIYTLQVNFFSRTDKENFQASIGVNIGSFLNASTKISQETSKSNIKGYITLSAFQQGGDPSQLGKVIDTSITQCSLENVAACSDAAKALINYVNNSFPNQFQKDDHGIWTSPLVPLGGYNVDFSVEDIGLVLANSYVDDAIKEARNNLDTLYNKSNQIYNLVKNLVYNYPVAFESKFGLLLEDYYNTFQKFKIFFLLGDGGYKAQDCYNIPYKCIDVFKEISSKWNIDIVSKLKEDIKFMEIYMNVDDDVNFKIKVFYNGLNSCIAKSYGIVNSHTTNYEFTSCKVNSCSSGFDYSYREIYDNKFYCRVNRYATCGSNVLKGDFNCDEGSKDKSRDSIYNLMKNEVISDILSFIL